MTPLLTAIAANAPPALAGGTASEGGTALGAFAALLAGLGGSGPPGEKETAPPPDFRALFTTGETAPGLAGIAEAAGIPLGDLERLAANEGLFEKAEHLFTELGALLAELGTALAAGEPPARTLLEKLDKALDALAAAVDIPLPVRPGPEVLAEIGSRQLSEGAELTERVRGTLGEIARLLLASDATLLPEARLAMSVGARIGALLGAFSQSETGEALLARLGLPAAAAPADPAPDTRFEALLAAGTALAKATPRPQEALRPPVPASPMPPPEPPEPLGPRPPDIAEPKAVPPDQPRLAEPARPAPAALFEVRAEPAIVQIAAETGARIEIAPIARPVVAGHQTSQQQINLPQIAFEIVRHAQEGASRFQLRLDPPELGRVDVRLEIDAAGAVKARLVVEKAETLDLMQRDQRALERALAQAGLDPNRTSLEFSLRQNFSARQDHPGRDGPRFDPDGPGPAPEPGAPGITLYRGALGASGLDILA